MNDEIILNSPSPSPYLAGTDYTSVNTSVSFSGSQQVNITVNTIEDDVIEQSEDFSASLSIGSAQNGLMVEISSPSATFTILDDEGTYLRTCVHCRPEKLLNCN